MGWTYSLFCSIGKDPERCLQRPPRPLRVRLPNVKCTRNTKYSDQNYLETSLCFADLWLVVDSSASTGIETLRGASSIRCGASDLIVCKRISDFIEDWEKKKGIIYSLYRAALLTKISL